MASPLSFFRKYQKVMLVFFGVALVCIFLIGPFFDQMNSFGVSQQITKDTVMAQWKGGKVTRSQLDMLRLRHFRTMEFLAAVQKIASDKAGENFLPLATPIQPLVPEGVPETEETYDEEIMERLLRSEKAREEGVFISDTMVNGYILQLAGNADFSNTDLESINRNVNKGEMELSQIREHLKFELASQTYSVMTTMGLNFNAIRNLLPTPTEAMQLYMQTARRIECEVYPLVVADYLTKVTNEPSDAELRKLFDEGRYELPDLLKIKPGFKLPKRVNVEYFVGDLENFLVNEMNKVTDREVQEEYDRLVAAKDPLVMEELNLDSSSPLPPRLPPNVPGGDAPPAAPPTTPPTSTPPVEGGGGVVLTNTRGDEFAYPEIQEQETQEQEKTQEEGAQTPPPVTQTTPPTQDPPVQTPPAQTPPVQTPPAAADQDLPPTAPSGNQDPVVTAPERKPKPLADVAEQIKRRLKTPAATELLNKAIEKADEAVQEFQSELSDWEVDPEQRRQPKPEPPDFGALAKELGLTFNSTGLLGISELADSEFGKVMVFVQEARNVFTHMQLVFGQFNRLQTYNPMTTNELMASKTYCFWLKEKEESKPVEFADARESVLKFWKHQQALALAKADAQKIADEANQSGKSLTELYADKAANTGEFSWFGTGMGGGFDFGAPVGVPAAAEEFMKAAFALQTGKSGVGTDELNERVYVIRMVRDDSRTPEMFAQEFYDRVAKDQSFPQEMFQVAQTYLRDSFVDWRSEFHKEMGFNWVGR